MFAFGAGWPMSHNSGDEDDDDSLGRLLLRLFYISRWIHQHQIQSKDSFICLCCVQSGVCERERERERTQKKLKEKQNGVINSIYTKYCIGRHVFKGVCIHRFSVCCLFSIHLAFVIISTSLVFERFSESSTEQPKKHEERKNEKKLTLNHAHY